MPEQTETVGAALAAIRQARRQRWEAVLWSYLSHGRAEVRRAALLALSDLLAPSEQVVRALLDGLDDRARDVRRACAETLADLGSYSHGAVMDGLASDAIGPYCAAVACHADPSGLSLGDSDLAARRLQQALAADLQATWKHQVAKALARREDGVARLLEVLRTGSAEAARFAAEVLCDLGDDIIDQLEPAFAEPSGRPWLAAVLASCREGRSVLKYAPQHGRDALLAALALDEAPVRMKLQVCKRLVICPGEEVGDALAACLRAESTMLQYTALRALTARDDPRAVPDVLERLERGYFYNAEMVEWLGRVGDARAIPLLKKLASPWRVLTVMPQTRHAARDALAAIEESLAHIPEGAISLAQPPRDAPTPAAISLWEEEETAAEAAGAS